MIIFKKGTCVARTIHSTFEELIFVLAMKIRKNANTAGSVFTQEVRPNSGGTGGIEIT